MKKILVLGLMSLLAFTAGILYGMQVNKFDYQDKLARADHYYLAEELQQAGKQDGFTNDQLIAVHAQIGNDSQCIAHNDGCYDPNLDTVFIPVAAFQRGIAPQALAYEYMHHVWSKGAPDETKRALTPDLYALDVKLRANPNYVSDIGILTNAEGDIHSPALTNELNSTACVKVQDNELTPQILSYCNAHLPNRSSLPRYY